MSQPQRDELEVDRLDAILPEVEQEDMRPDFLDPEPDDHAWVEALTKDLANRTGIVEPSGDTYLLDPSILGIDSETAWILGYQTAITKLRDLANGTGLEVALIEIEVTPDEPTGPGE